MSQIDDIDRRISNMVAWNMEVPNDESYGLVSSNQTLVIKPVFDQNEEELVAQIDALAHAPLDVVYLFALARQGMDNTKALIKSYTEIVNIMQDIINAQAKELEILKLTNSVTSEQDSLFPTVGEK